MRRKILRAGLVASALAALALGGNVYERTHEGNGLWHQGKYQDAFSKYMEASSQAKGSSEQLLHYDMGAALYKQSRYDEANKEFEQALAASDPQLKEKAFYNSGNCNFRTGISKKDIELLKKAAGNYQKALEIDPNDQDAKHNLEVVRRHIELQKQNQPPQQQQSQKNQQQDKDKKDQQKPNQQGQQQQQQAQQGQDKKEQDKQKQGQDKDKEKEKQPQAQQAQAGKPQELSKEEAERMLKSLSEQEKEQLKDSLKTEGVNSSNGKDW